MKTFGTLLIREWREWRTVLLVAAILYVIGLLGYTVAIYKGSHALEDEDWRTEWFDEDWEHDFEEDEPGWLTPGEFAEAGKADVLFFGWTFMLRVGLSFIMFSLIVLSLFYLVDAVFKERSDGTTFFYRGLPVPDLAVVSSKLLVGTFGFLTLSFLMGTILIYYVQITSPAEFSEVLRESGLSPFQIASMDLLGDWAVFHILALLLLLPYATYFLLVSTVTRSRPLLIGIGVPILLGILWRLLVGDNAFLQEITSNFHTLGEALGHEWLGKDGPYAIMREPVELFGSFAGYLFTLRSLVSILISGIFFTLTFYAYRRNLPVS
jgi:ABC-type transport system involved in multi-copper enzyme maturation permease subunit